MCRQPHYREVQRITQWWAWAITIAVTGFIWYVAVRHFVFNVPLGTNPPSDIEMIVLWIALGVGLPVIVPFTRLITEVDDDGISVQFVPLHLRPRRFAHDEIECAVVRQYRPIREYGGWGIRLGWRGWAYTMRGNRGVHLTLGNGKQLLIGSQQADALLSALCEARPHSLPPAVIDAPS